MEITVRAKKLAGWRRMERLIDHGKRGKNRDREKLESFGPTLKRPKRRPFQYWNHLPLSVSIQIRMIDTFPLVMGDRLDFPMRNDIGDVLGIHRQSDRHG